MKKAKIGRNDPCPCGSGKKYKNCCLGLEGIIDSKEKPFVRYSQLISTIKIKLDQHFSSQIKKVRKSLQDRFLRLYTAPHLPKEQESFLSDWLWFDVKDSEGMTFGGEYMLENGAFMEEPLRDCLKALNSSYLSLFQITGMENDNLLVKDFITGEDNLIMLKEPLNMDINEEQPLLLGRLVSLPLGKVFSGMVLMLNNDDNQGEFIKKHINYLRDLKGNKDISLILKEHGEILFGLYDRANHKALIRLNDIRVLRSPGNILNIVNNLDNSQFWTLIHETAGLRWYDLRESFASARMGVCEEYLVYYADNIDDIINMQNRIDEIVSQENWEIVNSLFLFQQPAPEMNDVWYTVIKDQETERWLYTSHRELDNKTPLDVMRDENGLKRLSNMLDDFASQTSGNEYSEDLIKYMRSRIQ